VQRLNGVYNGIMKSAGVELIGALGLPCKLGQASMLLKHALRACVGRLPAEGKGRVVDAGTVEITLPNGGGTRLLKTKNILIATGGAPSLLDIPGAV
jgi:hypothetical protein